MGDADVFGKLSRIFETHKFADDDAALTEILEDFDSSLLESAEVFGSPDASPRRGPYSSSADYSSPVGKFSNQSYTQRGASTAGAPARDSPAGTRRTPYEIWCEKNQDKFDRKKTYRKLNSEQWDRLVDKMHNANRVKQSSMIQEQNHGLATELEGYSFQPRINRTSHELSATMKPLVQRVPEMLAEREKNIEAKRKESQVQEMVECSFQPKRFGAKTSDYYLKRMGREKATPDDFYKFEEEKERRNDVRKQILTEMEERELTFRPQLSEKSIKLQEKMVQRGALNIDPTTRTAVAQDLSPALRRHGMNIDASADGYEEGPVLQIESEHPYRHNTNEFTTIQIPNAVSYTITFDESTRTEAIYDFVKFYDDETHTEHFGAGKYSGGKNGSPCNWPGVGDRPPLLIPASKFIVHFKTNGSVNDWGFRMNIVPLLCMKPDWRMAQLLQAEKDANNFTPEISNAAKNYQQPAGKKTSQAPVHERLYRDAVEKKVEFHNSQIDLMQTKLNVPLKPWENIRGAQQPAGLGHDLIKVHKNTYLPKSSVTEVAGSMIFEGADASVDGSLQSTQLQNRKEAVYMTAIIEFDDSHCTLWRQLRTI